MKCAAATRGAPVAPLVDAIWDGRVLELVLDDGWSGADPIALDLDACHFTSARVAAGEKKLRFEFPWFPSGQCAANVLPRFGRAGPALIDRPLQLIQGVADFAADIAAPQPLTPLIDAQHLLPFGSDCAKRDVVVVVPVYDAVAHVERCLDALLAHTRGRARLLLIDDASPDPAIAPLLQRYAGLPGIALLRNERNLGFTATANLGMIAAGRADVVLLNADTEVGPNWLAGLRRAAWSRTDIGTATAVSDNAGAFSVPELEQANDFPEGWSAVETSRALWQQAGLVYPELPTGNGFCMYLKRALLDAVGRFDEVAFARGYGEENDLCQRASALGWRHVIAGNVLVTHARSQSFGDTQRAALGHAGMAVLRERYPNYETDVAATLHSFERRVLDWRVRRIHVDASAGNAPLPRLLSVGDSTSAAPGWSVWRLRRDHDGLLLQTPDRDGHSATVATASATSPASASALWEWLQTWAIECIAIDDDDEFQLGDMARSLDIALWDGRADAAGNQSAAVRGFSGNVA